MDKYIGIAPGNNVNTVTWSSGATIDCSTGNIFSITSVTTTGTLALSNIPASQRYELELHLSGWTAGAITWPGSWSEGYDLTALTPETDYVIKAVTIDSGNSFNIEISENNDADALQYISAVESADGQALEPAVRRAITSFVRGCKTDGIWSAIKASCILAGARTLEGALIPLAGTAPTSVSFASGDYDRKTGLIGDGSSKYINTNRNNNADPQDNNHNAVYVTVLPTNGESGLLRAGAADTGSNNILTSSFRNRNSSVLSPSNTPTLANKLVGMSRSSSAQYTGRMNNVNEVLVQASQTPFNTNVWLYAREVTGSPANLVNARMSFYSIGEALDLEKLDNRVTALMNAFNNHIP